LTTGTILTLPIAKIEREIEREEEIKFRAEHGKYPLMDLIKGKLTAEGRERLKKDKAERAMALQDSVESNPAPIMSEKNAAGEVVAQSPGSEYIDPLKATDAEWRSAARAMRTASWGQMFFLITTDILGWSGAPFVFSSVGYGAGVALYIIFGAFATFSGWAIWKVYLELDSSRYPSYGDPFFRLFGKKSRHFINVAQSLQQFLTVAVLILSKTTNISQISKGKVCFSGMMCVVLAIGMISGIIRSLKKIGWLSNAAVFMNIANFLIIMIAAATYEPLYSAVTRSTLIKTIEPIVVFAGQPPNQYQQQVPGFASQFNAVNTMVYAYAGALLFVAFLAEMRHPMDFWKGLMCAQAFICTVYLLFGVFVYSYWGQYSANNIVNVIRPYPLQTAGNILTMLTGFIAVFMYFNIGMKTIYLEVFQQAFGFPPISTRRGQIYWYCLGPIYWILAFVVAAAVPNIGGIVSFVGALFMINFTYSFPGMLYLGHIIQKAAALPGEGFNPYTRVTTRLDTGTKRWVRGFKKSWIVSLPMTVYVLLGLACCGMGIWAAIEGLISVFGPGGTVATCKCFSRSPCFVGRLLIVIYYSFRMSRTGIGLPLLAGHSATSSLITRGLIVRSIMIHRCLITGYNVLNMLSPLCDAGIVTCRH
jgi:amino acid permease